VIEDDYDGDFRFGWTSGFGLTEMWIRNESVVLIGSFNKLLFSSLRVGYMVLPKRIETILASDSEST